MAIDYQNSGFTPNLFSSAKKGEGFIALISVIVITLILLTMTATLGTKGFLDRFNILEGEAKEISAGLAWACAQAARVKISNDPAYQPVVGGESFPVSQDPNDESQYLTCAIMSVPIPATVICVQGEHKSATTNYRVEIDENQDIVEIKEVTNQSDCN